MAGTDLVAGARRYNYRAYPSAAVVARARHTFAACRFVQNQFIAERNSLHKAGRHKEVGFGESARNVTTLLKRMEGFTWVGEVSSVSLQQAVGDTRTAYKNWFASLSGDSKGYRVGKPRFKKHGRVNAARFTRNERFVVLDTPGSRWGKVVIPSLGTIRFRKSRDLPSDPSSVTVIGNPDGTWEVSFVVRVPVEPDLAVVVEPTRVAGIDVGLTTLASGVTVDAATGEVSRWEVENPRLLKAQLRRLRRQQRALSRSQSNSRSRAKKKQRVAKTHARVAARRDAHHRAVAQQIVADHDAVAIETLSLKGMARTRLAKSVYDAGLGKFFTYLFAFAERDHKLVLRSGMWEPTSQTCSCCGAPGGKKPLSVREWTCTACDTRLHRDFNAAVNILVAAGLAETLNACGPDVRRLLASANGANLLTETETGTHRSRRDKPATPYGLGKVS